MNASPSDAKTFLIMPLEVLRETPETVAQAVRSIRSRSKSCSLTYRKTGAEWDSAGEETGRWVVEADDWPPGRIILIETIAGPFDTEEEADAEAERLNAEIDQRVASSLYRVTLPGVADIQLSEPRDGMSPGEKICSVKLTWESNPQAQDIEWDVSWNWNLTGYGKYNPQVVAAEIQKKFAELGR